MQQPESNLGTVTTLLEARHRPSGLNGKFQGSPKGFADYIALTRDMIARARPAKDAPRLQQIIDGNLPFELEPATGFLPGQHKPYKRGILLTHGLTDSPYSIRHLAKIFQENGFRVMAILLPGHGTRPGDLLDVSWREWAKAVAYATDELAGEADEIYLAGYSAGGALSVYQSLHDPRVRGLFLFSPALDITHRAAWANVHKLYSWLLPLAKWVNIRPDLDIYKYESFPKNAAAQLYALRRQISLRLRIQRLNIPIFTAVSQNDASVITSNTLKFMASAHHPLNHLVFYTTDPDTKVPHMQPEQVELIDSRVPEKRILSAAHTAITQPPEDPYYGEHGEYSSCLHYYPNEMEKYRACQQHPQDIWQGEVTEANLNAGLLQRLTYNPHFDELRHSIKKFIERLP